MTRSEARELAFILLFEKTFSSEPMSALIQTAREEERAEPDSFCCRIAEGAAEHMDEIDHLIASSSQNWKLERISRVALSALRVAVYEMLFESDIPDSVSINEAVELTKKFATQADSSFVNGVLGAIARRPAEEEKPS